MRWQTKVSSLAVILAVGLPGVAGARAPGAVAARAIPPAPAPADPPVATFAEDDAEIDATPGVDPVVSHEPETLSRSEMLSLSKKYNTDLSAALMVGERAREQAIHAKDVIRLSCIQDRLARMKLTRKRAEQNLAALDREEIRDDELSLRHEFRGVEMAREQMVQLRNELVDCVGESLEISDASPGGPTNDPASTNADAPVVDRPPVASNYR